MRRLITLILATVLVTGSVVAVTATQAQANHNCNYFNVPRSVAEDILGFSPTFRFWYTPRLYSSNAVNHCNRAVVIYSDGSKFDSRACYDFWVRQMLRDGTTRILSEPQRVCGGEARTLWCCLSLSAVIRVEGLHTSPSQRTAMDPWVGIVRI